MVQTTHGVPTMTSKCSLSSTILSFQINGFGSSEATKLTYTAIHHRSYVQSARQPEQTPDPPAGMAGPLYHCLCFSAVRVRGRHRCLPSSLLHHLGPV